MLPLLHNVPCHPVGRQPGQVASSNTHTIPVSASRASRHFPGQISSADSCSSCRRASHVLYALNPAQQPIPAPWSLTFDLRERETEWTEANKARLVALVAAQQLSIPMSDMEQRLEALMVMVPDLAGCIQALQPSLLATLTSDLQVTSSRLLGLKQLLPKANVSAIVASRPTLLLQDTAEVQQSIEALQELLQVDHPEQLDRLVEAQPLFLVPECVQQVLGEMQRLMPGVDAVSLLLSEPDWLLRLQRGQQWLGLHPDSQLGEQVDWTPPGSNNSSSSSQSGKAGGCE